KAQHAEIRRCAGARQHLAHAAGRVRGQANSRDLRRQALHRDGRRAYRRPRRRGHVDQGGQRDPLRRCRLRRGTGALKLVQDSVDGLVLGFFLLGAFLGAVTTGVAGFAMGLVVSGIWLHIPAPVQTVTLMVSYSVLLQGYGVWKLRHALDWRRVAPFIVGGTIGVPIGTVLLGHINAAHLRTAVGVVLLLYSIYYLARPALEPVRGGVPADLVIGFLNRSEEHTSELQ